MFEPRNPRVPGIGLAPQRDPPGPARGGLVDARFARQHVTDAHTHLVVRVSTAADGWQATPLTERRARLGVRCGGAAAEA
jgi:hypothetical protein